MKPKKILLGLGLVTALLVSGCSNQQKKTEPVLTKTAVIKRSQKSFKSGQVKQVVDLNTDTSSQSVASIFTFGGEPTIVHLNYETKNKNKSQRAEEWVSNTGTTYINGQSTWYKADLGKMTGHSYADVLDAIFNNEMLMAPPKDLVKAYQMKRKGNTYTLTATLKDKKIMQEAVKPIFLTNTQSPKQTKIYQRLGKEGKFKNMQVKLVVKNGHLLSFKYFVNMRIGKLMTLRTGQVYSNMRSRDFLKIPDNVLNAKPLPKDKQDKK
ncbi:DUF6612 family protein [Lactobacillus xylocopicola]|uniref:DNA polymerase n=1 Tax=Lactobacillus xylocopicola TaxID=2976676 RepID=A0ABM8BIH0_9LACO|nr:DUF6612 family protein [Lactobacillus xylocopicola]BDR61094.1 hypothetical protein KIM322_13550 [Lactobacillus xylocopicola]